MKYYWRFLAEINKYLNRITIVVWAAEGAYVSAGIIARFCERSSQRTENLRFIEPMLEGRAYHSITCWRIFQFSLHDAESCF